MLLSGEVLIQAPRQRVWGYLTDPQQVGQCAPGVAAVEVFDEGRKFRATVAVGFGTVKARFVGEAEWLERQAPDLARLRAHGTAPGGSAADVVGEMRLSDGDNGATHMAWTAEVTVLGQLASVASRLMQPVSQKLVAQFYACTKNKIEAGQEGPP
jgi:carbon monoxide dehydrogenase subunit G